MCSPVLTSNFGCACGLKQFGYLKSFGFQGALGLHDYYSPTGSALSACTRLDQFYYSCHPFLAFPLLCGRFSSIPWGSVGAMPLSWRVFLHPATVESFSHRSSHLKDIIRSIHPA